MEKKGFCSDIYTIGVMLHELLTGKPPFSGATTVEILTAHLTRMPPSLELDDPRGEALQAIVDKALAKPKDERYASAQAFAQALQELDAPSPSHGAPDGYADTVQRPELAPAPPKQAPLFPRLPVTKLTKLTKLTGVAGVVALAAFVGVLAWPDAPDDVEQVTKALETNDLQGAKRALAKLPPGAQTTMFQGHIALAEARDAQALKLYTQATAQAPKLWKDPLLASALIKAAPREGAMTILKHIAKDGPEEATALLSRMFEKGPDASFRRRAYAGLVRLDKVEQLQDPLTVLISDLAEIKTSRCQLRRWYVEQIKRFADPRVKAAIERERNRKQKIIGGLLELGLANRCMGDLLNSP